MAPYSPSAGIVHTVEITVEITEKLHLIQYPTSYCPNAIPDALPVYSVEGGGHGRLRQ